MTKKISNGEKKENQGEAGTILKKHVDWRRKGNLTV
jgi:hypothetical protein